MSTRLNRTDIERNISKRLGLKLTGDDAELVGDCLDAMINHILVEIAKGRDGMMLLPHEELTTWWLDLVEGIRHDDLQAGWSLPVL
ncbi:hypothetical protein QNE90_003413 [Vibrio alginolyticus]|nr:hypothetical protein [Vibrio alginolyticus]